MKKCIFLFVLAVAFIACNKQPQPDCGTYPYCISDFSIHPDNWLCGTLRPEPSPFDENDTVVAMKMKYVYDSDMNGLTYFITKNKEMFHLLDESGKRKDSILMCNYNDKKYVLYPYKNITDLPPEIVCYCNVNSLLWYIGDTAGDPQEMSNDRYSIWFQGCLNPGGDGVLIFYYEMEIKGGQTYDKVTETGDTIHMFDIKDYTQFDNVFYPV